MRKIIFFALLLCSCSGAVKTEPQNYCLYEYGVKEQIRNHCNKYKIVPL